MPGKKTIQVGDFYKGVGMSRRITKVTDEKITFDETLGTVVYPGSFCTPKEFNAWVKKNVKN